MATRTLAQFRAERQLWRKDVAQTLGISEEELEVLERSSEVPPEIAQKITAAYNLPPDYFAVDLDAVAAAAVQAQKKAPTRPFHYFFKVSFVWQLLVAFVGAFLIVPGSIFAAMGTTLPEVYYAVISLCQSVITLVSGIFLSSYIRKKTPFTGDLVPYRFLYPYLTNMSVGWVSLLYSLVFQKAFETENLTYLMGGTVMSVPILIVCLILGALYNAWLLQAAVEVPGTKKDKMLLRLFSVAIAAEVLYWLLNLFGFGFTGRTGTFYFNAVLSFLLLAAVTVGVLVGAKKKPQLEKLWFVGFPVLALFLPDAIAFVRQLAESFTAA